MESMIDFLPFWLFEREDFIGLFPGELSVAMLSPRTASVNCFAGSAGAPSK
jgi:hypothetical protein